MWIALILWVTPVSPESPCDEFSANSLFPPQLVFRAALGGEWCRSGLCKKHGRAGKVRDGLDKAFCRGVWSHCFGRESRLDVQERGCQALGVESCGMWGWPESSLWRGNRHGTQKEEGTATRGRENWKRNGRRLRKWGAAAWFQVAAGTHLDAVEHEPKKI